ncbi:transcriptional regulator NosR [Spongorhabdus nitratireducens]
MKPYSQSQYQAALFYIARFFVLISALTGFSVFSHSQDTIPNLLQQKFPQASFSQVSEPYSAWVIKKDQQTIGWAFETQNVVDIPAYSGKPVNMLVAIDPDGKILASEVLEHHEPILLVGIPEQSLFDFAADYIGLNVTDRVRVGAGNQEGVINVDAITGATVTVMVVNETVMRAAAKVAAAFGVIDAASQASLPATIKDDLFQPADWLTLTGDGSVRMLKLQRADIDQAFVGTEGEGIEEAAAEEKNDTFIELYYAPLNIPTVGRNLLGDSEYQWLMGELKPGDQAFAVMANGLYSFKGNGYVRGGIFDRIQLEQNNNSISFRDSDYYRLDDVYIDGFPGFGEMSIFIARAKYEFDPGSPWQLELLVRRQVGPIKSIFTSFYGDYTTPEKYITRPAPVVEPEPEPLWVSVWKQQPFQIAVLGIGLGILTVILFLQDILVRHPKLLHRVRTGYLVYTVFFIGWYALGQLSIVNVFTFIHALMNGFKWDMFLLDPMLFILWGFVAMTLLLWGRGIFCGWLCPFGALQELINELARKFKVKQYELPWAVHERLWAIKYIILLVLFAISLESLATAERYAEIEPFKTAITLKFQREWGFAFYAGFLLFISIFTRKAYCRYICPLGAALAVPARMRLFDWLKRRPECGKPCRVCANECEIQAIAPDGEINPNECHHCLDCQITYYNDSKCPPLILKKKKRNKTRPSFDGEIPLVQEGP